MERPNLLSIKNLSPYPKNEIVNRAMKNKKDFLNKALNFFLSEKVTFLKRPTIENILIQNNKNIVMNIKSKLYL
tara:strand:+ start:209 stop:430 length:222 start_codon:yes stop_codon:yes gene_type:complete